MSLAEPLPNLINGYLPNPKPFYDTTLEAVDVRFVLNGYREDIWDNLKVVLLRLRDEIHLPFADLNHDFISGKGIPRMVAVGLPFQNTKHRPKLTAIMRECSEKRIRLLIYPRKVASQKAIMEEFQQIDWRDAEDFHLPAHFRKAFVRVWLQSQN